MALHHEQFASPATEAVAGCGGHLLVEAGQAGRRGWCLPLACWLSWMQGQGTLLIKMRQPPVAQFDRGALFRRAASHQVPTGIIVQGLAGAFLGNGGRSASSQFAVEG